MREKELDSGFRYFRTSMRLYVRHSTHDQKYKTTKESGFMRLGNTVAVGESIMSLRGRLQIEIR